MKDFLISVAVVISVAAGGFLLVVALIMFITWESTLSDDALIIARIVAVLVGLSAIAAVTVED